MRTTDLTYLWENYPHEMETLKEVLRQLKIIGENNK